MRVRPSTLLLVGVLIVVAPLAPVVWVHRPTAWIALGGAVVLAGLGMALASHSGRRSARDSSPDSHHYIVCPNCDTRNYASRDTCRYCGGEFDDPF